MAAFRLTPSAEEHVGEIVEFIATDNEDAAVRVRHALYSAFDLLASRPGIGHAREDLTNRPLKFWSARIAVELDGAQHLDDPIAYRRDRRKDQVCCRRTATWCCSSSPRTLARSSTSFSTAYCEPSATGRPRPPNC